MCHRERTKGAFPIPPFLLLPIFLLLCPTVQIFLSLFLAILPGNFSKLTYSFLRFQYPHHHLELVMVSVASSHSSLFHCCHCINLSSNLSLISLLLQNLLTHHCLEIKIATSWHGIQDLLYHNSNFSWIPSLFCQYSISFLHFSSSYYIQ